MKLEEIKARVESGHTVHWSNKSYRVIKADGRLEWLIMCDTNGHCIGLTWRDGVTMHCKEEDFIVGTMICPDCEHELLDSDVLKCPTCTAADRYEGAIQTTDF